MPEMPTPEQFRELIKIAKAERLLSFECGSVKVQFHPMAYAPAAPKSQKPAAPSKKPEFQYPGGYTAEELFASADR